MAFMLYAPHPQRSSIQFQLSDNLTVAREVFIMFQKTDSVSGCTKWAKYKHTLNNWRGLSLQCPGNLCVHSKNSPISA